MLMLVTANNLLQLFFGWEGVGLVSYLLIGYWYERPAENAAAIKAFIVNRVGDLGFAVGIALTYVVFHGIAFDDIFAAVTAHAGDRYRQTTPSHTRSTKHLPSPRCTVRAGFAAPTNPLFQAKPESPRSHLVCPLQRPSLGARQ
jgi:hypothetical protein